MSEQVELSRGVVAVLDCAGGACQAGAFVDGVPRSRKTAAMLHGQAEALLPMLAAAFAEAGVEFAALSAVAVTVGPGSFTGLRVGLAAAHGLGLARDCPVVGVSSFAAWAQAAAASGAVRVVLDSRRGDAFVQEFGATGLPLAPPRILPPEEALAVPAGMTLAGDLAGGVAPALTGIFAAARVEALRLPPQPLYLREADVTLPPGAPRCS
jgi:tRNA threonylcarbamoyladenosine biosynthesis protein TsaB